jgi:mitogen-activated protein kinase 1/3/mitogen-activated protein kinase 6
MPIQGLDLETNCYLVQGTKFEVDKRYKIIEPMSHGAYGIVCSAEDKEIGGERVAVKKIEGVFEHITITKRTVRELRILRHLQHENLMQVKNIFITGNKEDFEEIYVVSELMETDLASTLRSSQALSDDHCQFFLYQILRGMKYVHSAQVIHRDLKPRNLLVNSNCDLKICDFGLARVCFSDKEWVCPMTEYVCTRWYRAPEVLCSWTDYSGAIDIWSIGCILAEMNMRKPLYPGHNTQHQLDLIIGLLGSPEGEELMKIPNEKCRKFIKSLPRKVGKPFPEVFADMSLEAQDLLAKMLRWDPESRITVFEAIQQPYLEKLHCPEDEPTRDALDTSDFEFERRKITAAALREEIFREALYYYPDLLRQFDEDLRETGSYYDITQYRLLVPGESQYSSDEDVDTD